MNELEKAQQTLEELRYITCIHCHKNIKATNISLKLLKSKRWLLSGDCCLCNRRITTFETKENAKELTSAIKTINKHAQSKKIKEKGGKG